MNEASQRPRLEPVGGPACWRADELAARDDWLVRPDAAALDELGCLVRAARDREVEGIERGEVPVDALAAPLARLRRLISDGPGAALLRGLPVEDWDAADAARALWILGIHLGTPQRQDAKQALIHHVRDTGADPDRQGDVRIYATNRAQAFHNDGGDFFMLLCRRPAAEGGDSRIVSAAALFDEVLQRDPTLAAELQRPFPFDARGDQLAGRPPVQRVPIFNFHGGNLFVLHKRPYIDYALQMPGVAPLTTAQTDALDLVDEICADPAFQHVFRMAPGDIVMANNFLTLHARDAFRDPGGEEGRHMIRLWIGLENGPKLPPAFRDTREFGPLFALPGRA